VVRSSNQQLIFGNSNWVPQNIYGIAPEYFIIQNWRIAEGRIFNREEVENNARVCVIGSTVARELFGNVSPIDCELRIRDVAFRVIGVLHSKGSSMTGGDQDDILFAPWTTIRMRITGRRTGSASSTKSTPATKPSELYAATGVALYPEPDSSLTTDKLLIPKFTYIDWIAFSASTPAKVKQAEKEITALLRERHRLRPMAEDDFRIRNSNDFMNMLNSTTGLMTNLLLGVALLSLLVGGVGIMNIMLVSVTERTREIGLRMAVGARSSDILKQFLVESIILCLVGGIIGILTGHGAAFLVNYYLKWPIESSPGAVIAAVGVSVFVGVVFGFYPAWKASKLDPIEALRYE
jgi:ABC-type antimicrobial peptide transport system permease subunit